MRPAFHVAALATGGLALFWAGNTPVFWDRIAAQVAASRSLTLSQNAHLFAQINIAMADGGFAFFDTKYRYLFWRPITAIREGGADGNPATDPDPAWTPWLDFRILWMTVFHGLFHRNAY